MTDTDGSIRWGIASTGKIAEQMVTALRGVAGAEVVAVGSRSSESAEAFAARHGIARGHGSYRALYDDPDVDIVYVASPHSHHHDMTIAALEAGKHVLCEKAFAFNSAEAQEMIDCARRHDRFLMEAMWTWFIPAIVELRRRIDAGAIGEIVVVESDFGIPVHDPDGRHRRPDLAGGALLDLGIYPLALARFLLGEPDEVRALGSLSGDGVDVRLGGVLHFPSGAISVFHTNLDAMSTLDARIVGTDGIITVAAPFWFTTEFTIRRHDGERETVTIPNEGLAHEAAHVQERVRAGHRESDVMTFARTMANMNLMDEIRRQVGVVYPGEAQPPG
jgi:predicted dehydrogenase